MNKVFIIGGMKLPNNGIEKFQKRMGCIENIPPRKPLITFSADLENV